MCGPCAGTRELNLLFVQRHLPRRSTPLARRWTLADRARGLADGARALPTLQPQPSCDLHVVINHLLAQVWFFNFNCVRAYLILQSVPPRFYYG